MTHLTKNKHRNLKTQKEKRYDANTDYRLSPARPSPPPPIQYIHNIHTPLYWYNKSNIRIITIIKLTKHICASLLLGPSYSVAQEPSHRTGLPKTLVALVGNILINFSKIIQWNHLHGLNTMFVVFAMYSVNIIAAEALAACAARASADMILTRRCI